MFAKLFYSDQYGQILVKFDDGDNGPEVRFYFKPNNLGVCSCALEFTDDEKDIAWDKAETAFNKIDYDSALSIVSGVVDNIPNIGEE